MNKLPASDLLKRKTSMLAPYLLMAVGVVLVIQGGCEISDRPTSSINVCGGFILFALAKILGCLRR